MKECMVARAQKRKWIDLVAGFVVGAATQPLALLAGPDLGVASLPASTTGGEQVVAQLGGGSSRARMALNTAIDAERLGDLDKAADLYREAQARANDLTAEERQELERRIAANTLALQARREAREQIGLAESAFQHGQPADAAAFIKKIKANELYLSAADKQRFQSLCQRIQMQPGAVPAASPNAAALAHDKIRQARAALAKGDLDAAETLAREADQLRVPLAPQEDSPRKILGDLDKARRDPKTLLLAARAALQRGQYDRAEQYARSAEQKASAFSFMVGDSPSKVLKEIETARAQAPANGQQAVKETSTAGQPAGATTPAANAEKARALVKEGREALARGDLVQARKCAEQAASLKADQLWSEDNPVRLLDDIARAAPNEQKPAAADASAVAVLKTKEEALALLKQGREQLAKGELEEANKTAARLRTARHIHWGLFFEDTPDKFQADVNHARSQRDKEQSVQMLAEARRRLEKKDYGGAEKLAWEAASKHGPYSMWDLGDRPNKLLAEIEAARQKERRVKLPDPPKTPRDAADLSHGPLAATGNNTVAANNPTTTTNTLPDPRNAGPTATPMAVVASGGTGGTGVPAVGASGGTGGTGVPAVGAAAGSGVLPVSANGTGVAPVGGTGVAPVGGTGVPPVQPTTNQVAANNPNVVSPYLPSTQGAESGTKESSDNLTAPMRARRLLAEARELQRQNRLLEARNKIDEARRLGVSFRPDEESPNQVYQQIAFLARQRIDSLVHHAGETIRYGTQAPTTRCQEAERDMSEARQLAVAFGQDTQPIELTLRMVDQLRTTGNVTLVSLQTEPGHVPEPSDLDKGGLTKGNPPTGTAGASRTTPLQPMQLLDQARLELRSGETANARHLAEEAVKLGAGEAGVAVIRSIDAEEAAQNRRRANRTFDEVLQAYRNRDYRRASLILASIDTRLLDESRQGRLREILNTPEMRPSAGGAIALMGAQEPSSKSMAPQGDPQPVLQTPSGGDAGHARATDDPGQSLLERTRAMREVKFQQLRTEGLSIQTQALERFRTGQTDVAVDMLQDYLLRLSEEQLDPGQFSLLRRPIESRLQAFQLLKAQAELANNRFDKRSLDVKKDLAKAKNAEQVKQKNIAQLMKQYNELLKEAKYAEAEMKALQVKELDPDNAMATAAVAMARIQRNHNQYESDKARKEAYFLEAMHDTDNIGEPGIIEKGIVPTKDKTLLDTIRNRKTLDGLPAQRRTAEELKIERMLTVPVSLSFANAPLRQVIEDIRGDQGINIFIDEPALAEKGISLESPVTMHLDNISLKSGLKLLLDLVHLRYVISDDVLKITTEEQARGNLQMRFYQVTDLVIAVENFGQVGTLPDSQLGMVNVNQAMTANLPMTPMTNVTGMPGGQAVGTPAGSSMANANSGFASDPASNSGQWTKQRAQTHEDMLIKLITSTCTPRSWAEQGGPGTIEFHPLTMALVINQTPDIQDQVQDLLNALRRLIDQEVAVEVKFISIAEDFFERIGVNFNMNIVNTSREALAVQPQLTSGQFAQPGFINAFNPGNLISGLTPAGTLTNDLNIPITTNTYSQAVPPFGGYPGIPGYGGLTLGLAFLSDIQVFLFMEAVQGDVRSNVMQAPKLTMFNGQTANLFVQDYQFFTIGVSVANGGFGQLVYNPLTTLFPLGTSLTIQAVISGDRRFVRLSLSPSLANIVNGEVNLFPVVTPIFPLFDGTATGQPVVFTQFVQQPRLTRVSVQTTVAVPDGGTVLMGGLKRLSEGRNEYGPPVISKIPYLSRLFRNIGYGRSAESLLIMVTPRIIIQAEEEEKQTGYTPPAAVAP
jgi:type II secretory pathway component GspD/PulD (secretin)